VMRFALISASPSVTGSDLMRMAEPMEASMGHVWEAWKGYMPSWSSGSRPSVMPWDDTPLPTWEGGNVDYLCPVYFTDDLSNSNTLAVHYNQGDRPAARVYVQAASGLNTGATSVFESLCHEGAEMMADPWANMWSPLPGRPGVSVADENADPVQDWYAVTVRGTTWRAANFVTPAWFGRCPGPVDHKGTLQTPGQVGPEGYLIVRNDATGAVSYEFGPRRDGFSSRQMNALAHPLSRTGRRFAGVRA